MKGHYRMKHLKSICAWVVVGVLATFLSGCSLAGNKYEKTADVDFTVVSYEQLPSEIKNVIEEKKTEEFHVVFTAGENMYIAIGYGAQESSGYSISVKDLYLSNSAIVVDTNLIGPSKGEIINEETTYPYIVIMLENTDYPVIFD